VRGSSVFVLASRCRPAGISIAGASFDAARELHAYERREDLPGGSSRELDESFEIARLASEKMRESRFERVRE